MRRHPLSSDAVGLKQLLRLIHTYPRLVVHTPTYTATYTLVAGPYNEPDWTVALIAEHPQVSHEAIRAGRVTSERYVSRLKLSELGIINDHDAHGPATWRDDVYTTIR